MSQPPIPQAFMDAILQSHNKSEQSQQAIQMPELALRCAQFFHSLSQYCLYFYRNYNRENDIHKTKLIKKMNKSKNGNNKQDNNKRSKYGNNGCKNQGNANQPEPPKKPITAYIIYFQYKKPAFAEKFPSLSLSELTKLIAKDWKDLSDVQKKPYLDKATNDRKRYMNQMNEFKKLYHQNYQNQYIDSKLDDILDQKHKKDEQIQVLPEDIQLENIQILQQLAVEVREETLRNKQDYEDEQNQEIESNNNDQLSQDEDDNDSSQKIPEQ